MREHKITLTLTEKEVEDLYFALSYVEGHIAHTIELKLNAALDKGEADYAKEAYEHPPQGARYFDTTVHYREGLPQGVCGYTLPGGGMVLRRRDACVAGDEYCYWLIEESQEENHE